MDLSTILCLDSGCKKSDKDWEGREERILDEPFSWKRRFGWSELAFMILMFVYVCFNESR